MTGISYIWRDLCEILQYVSQKLDRAVMLETDPICHNQFFFFSLIKPRQFDTDQLTKKN